MTAPEPGFSAVWLLVGAAAGYLLGSLPFGWLVARSWGVDIFAVGSKSCGATNVRRVLGARAGNVVFILDALKGAAAAGLPALAGAPLYVSLAGLAGALIGHSFSIFTGFRGGKGVATGAGGFLVLMPAAIAVAALAWALLFLTTRYVSLASMAAAVAVPVAAFLMGEPKLLSAVAVVVAVFVIFRHWANIRRLINGTESRAGGKPEPSP